MLKQSILMLCCTLAGVHLLSAATYYVNSSMGNDSSGNGSSGSPWKTLTYSFEKLSAGDTLEMTGTFAEEGIGSGLGYLVCSVSGTSNSPVTFHGGTLDIQSGSGDTRCNYHFTGDWLIFDGLKITTTHNPIYLGGGISLDGSHCIVMNCEVYGAQADYKNGSADKLFGFIHGGSYCTYSNIFFHEWTDGDLWRVWGNNNVITHCVISNVTNPHYDYNGLSQLHADLIQFWGGGSYSNVFECNVVTSLGSSGGWLNCSADLSTPCSDTSTDWVYRNNVFYNCGLTGQSIQNATKRFHVYNNVFYNWSQWCFSFYNDNGQGNGMGEDGIYLNNVFISASGVVASGNPKSETINYNAWNSAALTGNFANINAWITAGTSNYSIGTVDPGFVDAAHGDFHLTPSSPLRGRGINLYGDRSSSRTDKDGVARPASGAWDIGPYQFSSNPIIRVSPSSVDFGAVASDTTVTNTFTVQNVGGGTLVGKASVPAPFGIVSGGTYSLGSSQTQTVSVSYSPSLSNDSQVVTFTGGDGATASVYGTRLASQSGLSFRSYAGSITVPFVTNSGGYISQETQTGVADGGQAVYGFNITNAGNFTVSASVNAPDTAANSLYVNIDAQPTDPAMIWDIPPTTGFTNQTVSWRGNGTDTAPQYVPEVFSLSAGTHQLIIVGREAGVQLGEITIAPYLASRPTPPAPPPNLRDTTPRP